MPTTFIESEDEKFKDQLKRFANRLPTYSSALGVTTAEKNSATADANFFEWVLNWMNVNRDFSTASTGYKNLTRHGDGVRVLGDIPDTPDAGTTPSLVDANIQKRFSDLVGRIKKSPNYSSTIGDDLGIEAPDSPFNPAEGKPLLTVKLVEGQFPQIKFVLGEYEGLQILKGSGADWTLLTIANHPTYIDRSGMPTPGRTAIFSYKAIYMLKGAPIGDYSEIVSITVTGQ